MIDMASPLTLVVMAAGMGSRYGGMKQMAPVTLNGEWILDFSAFDAWRAGFSRVVFVIKPEMESDFRGLAGDRISKRMDVDYCHQLLTDLPPGFNLPAGREKPWGTAHAAFACRGLIKGPFAVINADDFYGKRSFETLASFLNNRSAPDRYAMVGFEIDKTLTEHGSVARGVCSIENGILAGIVERTCIERRGGAPAFSEDGGATWTKLDRNTTVSMNMWGFHESFLSTLENGFSEFLINMKNPLKDEYFLPFAVDLLRSNGSVNVEVLPTNERWHGVTYQQDREPLVDMLSSKLLSGEYPAVLWGE